jgi:hypothetical protein
MQVRIHTNWGTIAGFALLGVGAVLLFIDGPPVLQTVALGVLLLAATVYLAGRIWMFVKRPPR